jgi:hypothetical protein
VEDDPIEHAWKKVVAEWGDERAHKAFLLLCSTSGALGEAGRRYREVRENDPARADEAKRQIDKLLGMAMQNITALKTESPKSANRTILFGVAIVIAGALGLSAIWVLLRLS